MSTTPHVYIIDEAGVQIGSAIDLDSAVALAAAAYSRDGKDVSVSDELGVQAVMGTFGKPRLDRLKPATVGMSDPALQLLLIGNAFDDGAVIVFDGADLPTTWLGPSLVSTPLQPATMTPATVSVFVRNPDGTTSNTLTFTITV
jgi:hypothetical protein